MHQNSSPYRVLRTGLSQSLSYYRSCPSECVRISTDQAIHETDEIIRGAIYQWNICSKLIQTWMIFTSWKGGGCSWHIGQNWKRAKCFEGHNKELRFKISNFEKRSLSLDHLEVINHVPKYTFFLSPLMPKRKVLKDANFGLWEGGKWFWTGGYSGRLRIWENLVEGMNLISLVWQGVRWGGVTQASPPPLTHVWIARNFPIALPIIVILHWRRLKWNYHAPFSAHSLNRSHHELKGPP